MRCWLSGPRILDGLLRLGVASYAEIDNMTPQKIYRFRIRHSTNCLWCLILPFEPDAACVCQRTLQWVRGYLATNKKKEASTGLELPGLPAPPLVWQFAQIALSSPARSAVLHQAFSVPNVRVSA
jgi:hypothetical protein